MYVLQKSTYLPALLCIIFMAQIELSKQLWKQKISKYVKFGFSEKATKFEKVFVLLLTRASCSVRTTAYSRVRNKHSSTLILFLTFFQGLRAYSGLHRAHLSSISIMYKWGYAYSFDNFFRGYVYSRLQSTCQKVDEDFSKQMWTSHIIQTLTLCKKSSLF